MAAWKRRNVGISTYADAELVFGPFGLTVSIDGSDEFPDAMQLTVSSGDGPATLVWPRGYMMKSSAMKYPYGKSSPYGCRTLDDAVRQMAKELSFAEEMRFSETRKGEESEFASKTVTETVSLRLPDFSSPAELRLKMECC